ncbi:MAG: hypothetical protein M3Z21_06275, partial [Pseudomonadota bacterium]|nr:hypothetical protein [Pseudomonadota bacterium]
DALREWAEREWPTQKALRALIKETTDEPDHSPIIKPSDNWNFSDPKFQSIHDGVKEGVIPGDLYANILWYYSRPDDVVYCPMAGSGQIIRVWNERSEWMKPDVWNITLIASDLTPRGPYKDQIVPCDIATGACIDHADLIVMDLPYFGMVNGQYSDSSADMANAATVEQWRGFLEKIAPVCRRIQSEGGRVVTVCPNYVDWEAGRQVLTSDMVRRTFTQAGYELTGLAYSSRRIQQTQGIDMARNNKQAKERRLPLSDMAEVAVFTAMP